MSVTIAKPASGATLKGTVQVDAVYSGTGFDIATVTVDGQQLASDSSLPVSVSIDTTRVADGAHTLTVAVRYVGGGGKKRWQKASIPVTVKNAVAATKPSIPSGLVATPGDGKVMLKWNANPAGENVDRYQVYEGDNNLNLNVSGTSFVAATDHNGAALVNGRAYSFRVSAHNAVDYGDWTAAVAATPQAASPTPPGSAVSAATAVVTT